MLLTSLVKTIASGVFHLDYLIPAELFPFELIGTLFLLWSARRTHWNWQKFLTGLIAMIFFLIGGQGLAILSGLASRKTDDSSWQWAVVFGSLILFLCSVIWTIFQGVRYLVQLRKEKNREANSN